VKRGSVAVSVAIIRGIINKVMNVVIKGRFFVIRPPGTPPPGYASNGIPTNKMPDRGFSNIFRNFEVCDRSVESD